MQHEINVMVLDKSADLPDAKKADNFIAFEFYPVHAIIDRANQPTYFLVDDDTGLFIMVRTDNCKHMQK
jgi:hypothetical protein